MTDSAFPPPSAVLALDLTVNGKDHHLRSRFPLHVWDQMTVDEQARIVVEATYSMLDKDKMVSDFAPQVTLTRDEMPGATNLQITGAETRRLLKMIDGPY